MHTGCQRTLANFMDLGGLLNGPKEVWCPNVVRRGTLALVSRRAGRPVLHDSVDSEFSHLRLERGALHAELGRRALLTADSAAGVAQGADDRFALGGLERHHVRGGRGT